MHIPDMMLQGAVCPVTATIAAIGLAGTAYAAHKTKSKPAASLFAGVTALIFAAQMANFPILAGTSGHILGATLAVALLGSAFGIMAMTMVVLTQCLVFADGGISVLGANLLNMALIASLPAIIVRELFNAKTTAYGAAAFVSTLLAATACAMQLAFAGVVPMHRVLPAMLSVHALIALAEAGLTVALLVVLAQAMSRVAPHRAWMVPLGFAALVALVVSPFAAVTPDGLESVAASLGFGHMSGTFGVAPFAEYTVLTGVAGVVALFAVAYGAGRVFAKQSA